MLRALADGGVRMALVSSDNEANARRQLGEAAALFSWFDCGASRSARPPIPRILKCAAVNTEQAIAIGDESPRHRSRARRGIACGAVTWGYALPETCGARADLVFERMEDIASSLRSEAAD